MLVQQNSSTMLDWLFCNEVGKLPNVIAESMVDGASRKGLDFCQGSLASCKDPLGAGCKWRWLP
jgi:hypothetical protein